MKREAAVATLVFQSDQNIGFSWDLAIYRKLKGFCIWGDLVIIIRWTKAPESRSGDTVIRHLDLQHSHLHLNKNQSSLSPSNILIYKEHLATMQGWNFPVTLRLPACVFLPRKLRVALRMQLWKKSLSFYLVGWNILPTDRWGPSRTTAIGFESLHR